MLTSSDIQNLKQSIIDLGQELTQQAQDAHGFFTTKTRYAVSYQDLATRQRVQEKLDHAVAMLAIANIMAIFEKQLPKKFWTTIFQDSKITVRLKAYRHIRYSAVNGFTGSRAKEHRADFDKVMSGTNALRGIKLHTDQIILLDETAANFAFEFIRRQYERAIVKIHQI